VDCRRILQSPLAESIGMGPPVPMLVISGPPGVGKTTVAWEVFSRAAERDESPALADLDLLGAAWPAPEDDPFQHRLKARNLASVWSNFRETGSRCLIVAAVIETGAELDMLGSAVGAEVFLCRLTAPNNTLADRIRGRGRDFGDDLTKLVKRSAELSELLANHDVSDLVVDTEGQPVGEVAETLLAAWRR